MNRSILALLLCGFFAASAAAQSTIFIVRHAEKAEGGGNDPDLSQAGRTRAESLAGILKEVGITAIYATEFKRTQETAAPLAKAIGIEVVRIAGKSTGELVAKLHDLQSGNALVVGHSNTIPELTRALGVEALVSIAENDYDNLFVVVLDKKPRLLRLHYR
jgi:2,3-bisphosphoglycerate-dependent phosphoglycerate mutase